MNKQSQFLWFTAENAEEKGNVRKFFIYNDLGTNSLGGLNTLSGEYQLWKNKANPASAIAGYSYSLALGMARRRGNLKKQTQFCGGYWRFFSLSRG